jgi:Protein of unknown function (DUF6044)
MGAIGSRYILQNNRRGDLMEGLKPAIFPTAKPLLRNQSHAIAMLIIVVYVSPFLLLGEQAHLPIHDVLDDFNFISFDLLSMYPEYILAPLGSNVPAYMGGIPRDVYPSEFNYYTWLNLAVGTVLAYSINELVLRATAYFGMFLLGRDWLCNKKSDHGLLISSVSICFAVLPFWPSFLLSIAAMPLVFWAFNNLCSGERLRSSYSIVALYPFASSLVYGGMFTLLVGCVSLLIVVRSRRFIPWHLAFALALMLALEIVANYRLLWLNLVSSFVSHREDWNFGGLTFVQSSRKFFNYMINGQYHVFTGQYPAILTACLLGVAAQFYEGKFSKKFRCLLLIVLSLGLIYGFYRWAPIEQLKAGYLSFLIQFQLDRLMFLNQALIYVLFLFALLIVVRKYNWGLLICAILIGTQLVINVSKHPEIVARSTQHMIPSFSEFYGADLFERIKRDIGRPTESFRVASVAMHPAIAVVNGFYTVDGYSVMYPLQHKRDFRKIISSELAKSAPLSTYFDDWGSRAYLFSSEIGKNYLWGKHDEKKLLDLKLSYDHAAIMGVEYIFSSAELTNFSQFGLVYMGFYESPESYWRIHVYRLPVLT